MIAFVTGGTGFIGQRLVKKLIEQNYRVVALVRDPEKAGHLVKLGAQIIQGDILEPASMVYGMENCDVVFHLAGWYKLGSKIQSQVHEINVVGTQNVLEQAWKMKIPRIIYTSSLCVYGDTFGLLHDENYQRPPGQSFLTEYDRTKWQAHYQIAIPMIAQGAPITIVIPSIVYGPNDKSLIGQLIQAYLKGRLMAFPGPETTQSFSHVDDIAEGHLLAHKKGQIGQSYILAGPAYPLWQIVKLWAALSRKSPPKFYIPSKWLKPLEPLANFLANHFPMPELLSVDGIRLLGSSFIASSHKAKTELGWQLKPIETGFKETLDWYMKTDANPEEN